MILNLQKLVAGTLVTASAVAHAAPPATVVSSSNGRRIVSLQPSLTEIVCALDACKDLVGVDRYSNWPNTVQALPRVGSLSDAQVELIVALKPDLVLMRPRNRAVDRLQALGVPVLTVDATSHGELRAQLEVVAKELGRPGAGIALWEQIQKRVNAVRARVPAHWVGKKVYMEVHGGHAAASESSFIGETLTRLGLKNVVPGDLGLFPKLGPEFALRANPDVLISTDAYATPAVAGRPGWSQMPAVKKGHVCRISAERFDVIARPGPRIDEAAEEILNCLLEIDRRNARR